MIRTVKDLAGSLLILVVIWSYGRYFNRSFLCRKGFFRISIQFHLWQKSMTFTSGFNIAWQAVNPLLCWCSVMQTSLADKSSTVLLRNSPLSCHSWQVLRCQFDAMQQRKAKQEGSPEAIKLAARTLALHDDKPTLPETNVKQINLRLTAPDAISEV